MQGGFQVPGLLR